MAKPYVLITTAEYERLKKGIATVSAQQSVPEVNKPVQLIEEKVEGPDYEFLINLLPKTYRNRAKMLLHYLKPNLSVQGRIVYEKGNVGSHILDLLKFVLMPKSFRRKAPNDIAIFVDALKNSGAPDSAYVYDAPVRKWLTFE